MNLSKGQTGLSVAFDLPTQTGYDSDHVLARGEVGKVGVPICHLGDMRALFDQIPLEQMNTSMPCAASRRELASELETAPTMRSRMPASASMKWLTVEPVPTPTMLPSAM